MRSNRTKTAVILLGGATLALVLTTMAPSAADATWWRPQWRPQVRVTPEIDPGVLASTIALVAGGVAMLTDRRRRK